MTDLLPLTGIRVIDLTRIYSGPYATFLMAMAGAEVIKVEVPEGEHLRGRNAHRGASLPFAMLNANKRAITLNLKKESARRIFLRLVETADVVVDNYRPGVMDKIGLSQAVLRAANPRIILASTSGFGSSGPYRNYPAMDLTIQAISGIIATTGEPDRPPVKAGPAVGDFMAGVHLYAAITTALLDRERHGRALTAEVAMTEAIYPSLASNVAVAYGAEGKDVLRTGNRHGGMALAPYNVYPTSDGYAAVICNNDTHWRKLLQVLGRPELAEDPRFLTMRDRCRNIDDVDQAVGQETVKLGKEELFKRLNAVGVPCGPVRTLQELLHDPQLWSTGMLHKIDHPEHGELIVQRSPIRFAEAPQAAYEPSRRLGEDTESLLADELGLSADDIAALRKEGSI